MDPNREGQLSVASNGGQFLAVWTDLRDGDAGIWGVPVSLDGAVEQADFPISTGLGDRGFPSVIFGGTDYLVVWDDSRSRTSTGIYGARVAPTGAVRDSAGRVMADVDGGQKFVPGIGCNGPSCLIAWSNRAGPRWDIRGILVDSQLNLVSGEWVVVGPPSDAFVPATVAGDGGYLIAWAAHDAGQYGVRGTRVDSMGGTIDDGGLPLEVVRGTRNVRAAVAFDGARFWVAWEDDLQPAPSIQMAIIDSSVFSLAVIAPPDGGLANRAPALSFDGARMWLAFQTDLIDAGMISGLRFELDGGAVEGPLGLSVPTAAQRNTALGSDGNGRTLLLYESLAAGADAGVIHCVVLDESGSSPDAGGPTDAGPGDSGVADGGGSVASDAGPLGSSAYRVSCGCDAVPPVGLLAVAAVLVLVARRRTKERS